MAHPLAGPKAQRQNIRHQLVAGHQYQRIMLPQQRQKIRENSMQAPFIPRCQPSLHTKTRPNVAERWIVSVEKICLTKN